MPVYEVSEGKLAPATLTRFDVEGLRERQDMQRMLRDQIAVLGEALFVLSDEYGGWIDSNRRIDLLCVDLEANIVVVELKRDDAGHMELQAIRYAAMIARMTFAEAVEAHTQYLRRCGQSGEDAEAKLLAFLSWQEAEQEEFGSSVRIILASAAFGKELTTTVLWLREQGLDISCVRLSPYKLADGRLLLDVQPIIPLPEATQFQTQIGLKRQAEQKAKVERHEVRYEFWQGLLAVAAERTTLHAGRSPSKDNWISAPAGVPGFNFSYTIRQRDSQVHLWIEDNQSFFLSMEGERAAIEDEFGGDLVWKRDERQRGTLIGAVVEGGYRSNREDWPKVQQALVEAMVRLERVMRPRLSQLRAEGRK
jgi:hypothetical protein